MSGNWLNQEVHVSFARLWIVTGVAYGYTYLVCCIARDDLCITHIKIVQHISHLEATDSTVTTTPKLNGLPRRPLYRHIAATLVAWARIGSLPTKCPDMHLLNEVTTACQYLPQVENILL